jgi:predicted kinase
LYGDENIQGDGARVFKIAHHDIREYGCLSENVVFDATNINADRRKELVKSMRGYFDIIIFKWFDVATAVCLERNRQRERQVPEEVIWRMARTATVPTMEEGFDYVEIIINY